MTTDGDDNRAEEISMDGKRCLDLLATVRGSYDEDETRTVQGKEEDDSVSTELCLFKQKSDGRENQEKPTYYHDNVSSSSTSSLSSVVSQEPIKGERGVTPEWLVNLMRTLNGVDAKLVTDKMIQTSDVNPNQGRLLIPFNQIAEMDFLNEAELNIIDEHQRGNNRRGLDVIVVSSDGRKWNASLRRWNKNCPSYALCSGWNHLARENMLKNKVGQIFRLWSFRSLQDGKLYLAFFHQPPDPDMLRPEAQDQHPDQAMHAASSSSTALDRDSISERTIALHFGLGPGLQSIMEALHGNQSLRRRRGWTSSSDRLWF